MLFRSKTEGLAEGREEGREKGREEGREEGKKMVIIEMAKKAIENGLANEMIRQLTGLTDNEIDNLRNT